MSADRPLLEIGRIGSRRLEMRYRPPGNAESREWIITRAEAEDLAGWWRSTGAGLDETALPTENIPFGRTSVIMYNSCAIYVSGVDPDGRQRNGYFLPRAVVERLADWLEADAEKSPNGSSPQAG